jgi:tripartite-type tricarboxylate transporter receptor subunit TctC
VVAHLIDWFIAALVAPDVSAKLADLGLYPVGICGDNFADHIRRQSSVYGRVIRESNIKVD